MSTKEGYAWRAPALGIGRLIALLQERFPAPGPAMPDSEKARYITERANEIDFWYFQPNLAGDLVVNWDNGRVFSPVLEVRWRKLGVEMYDVLVLAEQALSLSEEFRPVGQKWQVTQTSLKQTGLYLWGDHRLGWEEVWRGPETRPYWTETRIPYRLHYPAVENGAGRSMVRVGGYRYSTEGGVVQFVRLAEVEDVAAKK